MVEDGAPTGSFCLGGSAPYALPAVEGLAVGGDLSWLFLGSHSSGEMDVSSSAIVLTAQAYYFVPTSSKATPFFAGGGGLYNMRAHTEGTVDVPLVGPMSADETNSCNEFGVNFGGGVKVEGNGAMAFGADVRFHVVFTDVERTNLLPVMGKVFF